MVNMTPRTSTTYYKQIAIILLAPAIIGCMGGSHRSLATEEKLILASNGQAHYKIVCQKNASQPQQLAADELKRYLEKITDANFVQTVYPANHSIIVCSTQSLKRLNPQLNVPELYDEGFCILVHSDSIYLIGAADRAVLYAVYDFLNRLGCRWLAPDFEFYGGNNEYVPKQTQLTYIHQSDIVEKPQLRYRKLCVEEGLSHNAQNLRQLVEWMPKLRFNTLAFPINYQAEGRVRWDNWREELTPELQKRDIIIEVGGHGYQNFIRADMGNGRLFDKHPEWFRKDKQGNRRRKKNWVFCTSNPQAVEYLQNNVLDYLKKRPEIGIFDFWPPDGGKWCCCTACRILGNVSDRHAMLVSQMAGFLNKHLPHVRTECVAYSYYFKPPQRTQLDESVLLDFCPISQNFQCQIYEDCSKENSFYTENLKKWLKVFKGSVNIYSYYRKYAWRSLPNIIPRYMQKDLQYYRRIGTKGVSIYAEPGDWFTFELNYYALGHLAWNTDVNVEQLIEDFCRVRYGPAAKTAKRVYTTLENVVRHACSIPYTKPATVAQYKKFTKAIESCISQVREATCRYSDNRILHKNLCRLNLMLGYAAKDIAIQQHRAAKGPKAERQKMVDELIAFVYANARDGVFIPHGRFDTTRLYTRYGILSP